MTPTLERGGMIAQQHDTFIGPYLYTVDKKARLRWRPYHAERKLPRVCGYEQWSALMGSWYARP